MAHERRRDRASMTVVTAVVVAIMMVVVVSGTASLGEALTARQRAQAAADAAALAGASSGPAQARRVAALNDAELIRIVVVGNTVDVIVAYGDQTARARATTDP